MLIFGGGLIFCFGVRFLWSGLELLIIGFIGLIIIGLELFGMIGLVFIGGWGWGNSGKFWLGLIIGCFMFLKNVRFMGGGVGIFYCGYWGKGIGWGRGNCGL